MDLSTPSAGALTGYRDKFSWRFLGIKYATSTRFAPPVALSVSEGEHRNATLYGPRCAQPPDADNGHLLWTNEDCLYLNVYSPIVNTGTTPNITSPKLPVMFFIHGGGLNTGDSGPFPYNMTTSGYVGPSISNIYDGTNLVSFGYVVLVTINYRLTAFGWFNASNAALKDTLMALEWVQENIEAFGGDKSKVLVFGESAGAIMSRYLIGTNPKYTTGLFSTSHSSPSLTLYETDSDCEIVNLLVHPSGSIILESDFSTLDPFVSPTIAQTITSLPLAKALNCTPTNSTTFTPAAAECVAALPAGDVALASYDLGISWDITIDGDYILTDIATSIEEGVYAKVPTIWASNACEYCYFLGPPAINPTNTSSALFPAYLSTILNATAVALISNATTLWPYETEPPPVRGVISGVVEELGMFVTDYAVRCPMGYLAGLMDGGVGGGGAYKVEFGIGLGSPLTPNPAVCVGQVCHADELYFVFATAETDNLYQPLTTTQLDTTREVIKRWASLARSGTPNYWGAQVVWQPYTMGGGAGENVVVIGSGGIQNGGAYRAAQCEFIVSQLGLVFGYD
ncbi:hypothetical protein JAAARDRAFT_62194 [Jaapia argillacea MUCL 33604]|uniref:Carboxylic ester hydrolase n=1 Tax=Jaapia argillacea MUCL 33604 TaxID=933084 RepID=A0A067PDZ2_9AGAM|nr:hypothetical protein JAAARDRAFT_62194 [Jaapia argillacea MUCL 33604]